MSRYLCVVDVMFVFDSDTPPNDLQIMEEARNRLTPGFPRYGVQVTQTSWDATDAPPVPTPAPVAKKWKVIVANANIRNSPPVNGVLGAIVGLAKQGDVFEQSGTAVGWVEVGPDRWISLSVLAAV